MDPLITPAQAEATVLQDQIDLDSESIPLESASGRILAADLVADRPLPPYDRVMMDGICFRAAEAEPTPTLKIHGLHPAGNPQPEPLPAGHCWEVMTGACFPSDCDTVVPYEEVTPSSEGAVSFPAGAIQPGKFIHRAGSDFAEGDVLVPAFTRLDARAASVAATIGATLLSVLRKPRVVILTTGDEVVPPELLPEAHQVRQSNAASLRPALHALGADLLRHLHVPDDEAATEAAVRESLDADLVLLCGGISKGKRDFVRPVIENLVGPPAFHGIAQRPGKPLAFWPGSPPIFALPGNPMSVLVCFHRYVRPLLESALRQDRPGRTVQLASPVRFEPPMSYFLPVCLRPDGATILAEPHSLANSGDFASSIGTDGFVELPAGQIDYPSGFLAAFHEWL